MRIIEYICLLSELVAPSAFAVHCYLGITYLFYYNFILNFHSVHCIIRSLHLYCIMFHHCTLSTMNET